jgi:hypothetical protein
VLICRVHGYALSSLPVDLRDQHPDIHRQARKAIVSEYTDLEYSPPSNADFGPGRTNPLPAIDGLTVHDGFTCGPCGFLTSSWKWFQVHWNKDHTGSGAEGKQWSKVQLQTFFTGPKLAVHYFCVTVAEAAVEAEAGPRHSQLMEEIKEQWASEREHHEKLQKILAAGVDKHETTNC